MFFSIQTVCRGLESFIELTLFIESYVDMDLFGSWLTLLCRIVELNDILANLGSFILIDMFFDLPFHVGWVLLVKLKSQKSFRLSWSLQFGDLLCCFSNLCFEWHKFRFLRIFKYSVGPWRLYCLWICFWSLNFSLYVLDWLPSFYCQISSQLVLCKFKIHLIK